MPTVPDDLPPAGDLQQLLTLAQWWVRGVGVEPGGAGRVLSPGDLAAAGGVWSPPVFDGLPAFGHRHSAPDAFHAFPPSAAAAPRATPEAPPIDVPFAAEITRAAARHALDPRLIAAIVEIESGFDPRVVSPRGAQGLMQIMPATAQDHGHHDLFDPRRNLEVGTRYFGSLLARFEGDVSLALAAYNAGPGAVQRFGGVPPFRETSRFVEKVLRRYEAHRATGDMVLAAR